MTVQDLSEQWCRLFATGKIHNSDNWHFVFLWTWNDLLLPSIMISDVNLRTITVNLYMFKSSTNAQWDNFDCRIGCKYDTNYNYLYCRTETYYKRFNSGCSKIKKTGEVKMSTFYEDNMNIKR